MQDHKDHEEGTTTTTRIILRVHCGPSGTSRPEFEYT
jgi:hypothetical protein